MPINLLADGTTKICVDQSLNVAGEKCRVLYEGQYSPSTATADPAIVPDVPMKVNKRCIEEQLGESFLTEAVKTACCTCSDSIEVWVLPREDAAGAVCAEYEETITGPATSNGFIDIFRGDEQYSVDSLFIQEGDTAATIAAAIAAATPANFPFVPTVAGDVITWVAKNCGTIGNHLATMVNWKGLRKYYATGVSADWTQTVVGDGDPEPLDYNDAFGTCCFDCVGLLTENLDWQLALTSYIEEATDCDGPQCFTKGYTYNAGTLGDVLGTFTNSRRFGRLAWPEKDIGFPWAHVAAEAALSCCKTCDNPELSIQGREEGVLDCIKRPATCSSPWSYDERKLLNEQGFRVHLPLNINGVGMLTSPYVIHDITNALYDADGNINPGIRSFSYVRLNDKVGLEVAEVFSKIVAKAVFSNKTRIKQGVFGVTKNQLRSLVRAWARSQVGVLFSEFDDLDRDITIEDDFDRAARCQGKPCVFYLNMRYRLPCSFNQANINLQPMLIDNCDR